MVLYDQLDESSGQLSTLVHSFKVITKPTYRSYDKRNIISLICKKCFEALSLFETGWLNNIKNEVFEGTSRIHTGETFNPYICEDYGKL